MTILQLKNFLIVAETLNFRKAAEKILIAQPALSRQIHQLEEQLGAQLFDRTKKNIKLTEAGEYFKIETNRIIHQLEEAMNTTSKIFNGEAGEVRIGHSSSAMQSLLARLLKLLYDEMPALRTVLAEDSNKIIIEKLLNRELDYGFIPNANIPKELKGKILYKENFVLIVSQDHHLTKKTFKSLADCANDNWIFPPQRQGSGYMEFIHKTFQRYGFSPSIIHESANGMSVLKLVEAGLGITIIAKSLLNSMNLKVRYFELTDIPEKVEMRMVWLSERDKELKKTTDIFLKYIALLK